MSLRQEYAKMMGRPTKQEEPVENNKPPLRQNKLYRVSINTKTNGYSYGDLTKKQKETIIQQLENTIKKKNTISLKHPHNNQIIILKGKDITDIRVWDDD
mgnify:CR=1 FL=1